MAAKTENKSDGSSVTSEPVNDITSRQIHSNHIDPGQIEENEGNVILLSTMPERASFFYKYLMAFSPVLLVILSYYTRILLQILFNAGSSAVGSAVSNIMPPAMPGNLPGNLHGTLPGIMSNYTNSALTLNQYAAPVNYASIITILMIAPVGIFIFFAATGWTMRLTELWTSASLTLGMSGLAGIIMAGFYGVPPTLSSDYLLLLLKWIEFLVQPFCIVAAVIVIIATEKFRQSITYTITKEGVGLRGGFLFMQEHMLPHNQIGRIVVEQDFLGKKYNYGTLIPLSMTRWGEETSFRAIGASGQKDNFGMGVGFAKGRQEGSRYPLDCFYGIPDPKKAQDILTGLICKHDKREDEQVSYLRKIYEIHAARTIIHHDANINPYDEIIRVGKTSGSHASTLTGMHDIGIPETTTGSVKGNVREIPTVVRSKNNPLKEAPADSVLDTIKNLAELKNTGVITEEEFNTKKTELLNRL